MTITVCETVKHYHQITIEDELDPDLIIRWAREKMTSSHTGYEAIEEVLKDVKHQYGHEYTIKPNYCGTDCVDIDLEDVVED